MANAVMEEAAQRDKLPEGLVKHIDLCPAHRGWRVGVRLIPQLSAAALKTKLDKEVALWYELRTINRSGSGRVLLKEAVAEMVSLFGYSDETAYRLLRAGDGRFWEIRKKPSWAIKIRGLCRVAQHFGIPRVTRPVEIPAELFRGRRAKRAWLYASFFKPDGSRAKPISRDSINVATGVRRRQQRRYDKVARIKKIANHAFQKDGRGKLVPVPQMVEGKSKTWVKNRRLGNTYYCRALRACRGMLKRVNGELRQRSSNKGEARLPKRFFLSPRSLVRTPVKHQEPFLMVKAKDRLIRGRLEWCVA